MRVMELWAENIKRITVVQIIPKGRVVEISGKNGQGKTSVLDAMYSVFGGEAELPEVPLRAGETHGRVEVKLGDDEGMKYIVERRFTEKGTYLYLSTPDGARFQNPQTIIKNLMQTLTFDPLGFMREKPPAQLETLRGLVKIELDIDRVDEEVEALREERTNLNRQVKAARAQAEAIAVPADLPDETPDIDALTAKLANVDEHNAKVRGASARLHAAEEAVENVDSTWNVAIRLKEEEIARLRQQLGVAVGALEEQKNQAAFHRSEAQRKLATAKAEAPPTELQDSQAILAELKAAQAIADGIKLRDRKIEHDAAVTTLERASDKMTTDIEALEKKKTDAIGAAEMPIPGLAFGNGMVLYNKLPLSQASDSEQLRVSMAIAAALNPKLRVLRIRDGSLLDEDSMALVSTFAEEKDFQIWIERVDSSGRGEIIMEEGHIRGQDLKPSEKPKEETTGKKEKPAPTDDDTKRAQAFMQTSLATLAACKSVDEADRENARVKQMLKRFPKLIQSDWNAPYLSRVRELTR